MPRVIRSLFLRAYPDLLKRRRRLMALGAPLLRANALRYRGDRVFCPCCGGRFRRFLPFGVRPRRPGALCPRCLSLERHRMLWLFLHAETNLFRDRLKAE